MIDKWYEEDIYYGCDEYNKRRKNLRKHKARNMCNMVIGLSLFCAIGFVGGAEQGRMTITEFVIYELITIAILLVSFGIKTRLEEI